MKPYLKSAYEALKELKSAPEGLSSQEAASRLQEHGPNRLKEGEKVSLLTRFLKQLADPMIIVLLAAAVLSGITAVYAGESMADVFIILFVVILNSVLGVVQESKAEDAIAALKTMTAATSKVMRDGRLTVVHSDQLVPGDVIHVEAGDAVPADCRILECASLKVEEAALTGESVPVVKSEAALTGGEVPLGDRKNMMYMGSTVVYGRGSAVVCDTGMATEMGKIADALSQAQDEQTPLQRKLAGLSKVLTWLVLSRLHMEGLALTVTAALLCYVLFRVLYPAVSQLIGKGEGGRTVTWTVTADALVLDGQSISRSSIKQVHCWPNRDALGHTEAGWTVNIETQGKNQVLRSLKEGENVERSARQLRALVIALGYQSRCPEE